MKLRVAGQWANLLVAGALMFAVWLLMVWVGSRPALKALIDLTPQQSSTIDPVSVDLLRELSTQGVKVELHTFFERGGALPQDPFQRQRRLILQRLQELTDLLLRQYAFHGGESLSVVAHDLYGDVQGTREAVQRLGVTSFDVIAVSVQQPGRPPRHRTLSLEGDLAIVEIPEIRQTNSPLPQTALPLLKNYKGEEAISSALKSLLVQGTPVVCFLNGNSLDLQPPTSNAGASYSQLYQTLRALGIESRELDLSRTRAVPEDASVVAILEPRREFADSEVRALHDYLRRGGRMFVNYSWAAQPDWNPTGGELGKLLGFELGVQPVYHLIADPRYGSQVRGLDGDPRVSKLDLMLNPNHPITMRLARSSQMLQMDQARPILRRSDQPKGVRYEALVQSGPQAWLATPGRDGFPDTRAPAMESAFGEHDLGAVIEVDGEPKPDGSRTTGRCVVMTGLFCNNLGMAINANLCANAFNWLVERNVLLDIQGSRYVARHFELAPQQQDRVWWLLVIAVPASLLLCGMFVAWRRRDR